MNLVTKKDNKLFSNYKNIFLITINIIAVLYIIDSIKIGLKNKITNRKLEESDRTSGANEICMEFVGVFKYDLLGLKDIDTSVNNSDIELKFCKNIGETNSSCIYKNDSSYIRLAGDINGEENNKNKIEVKHSDDLSQRQVTYYLAAGDKCKFQDTNYKVTIQLYCDNSTDFKLLKSEDQFDPYSKCDLTIEAKSKYACGEENEINQYSIFLGILLSICGFITAFFGYHEIGIYFVNILLSLIISYIIIMIFEFPPLAVIIIIIIIFLLLAIGFSIIVTKNKKKFMRIYTLLIGGACGYGIGDLIVTLFIAIINTEYQKLIRYIIIIILIIIGCVIGFFLYYYIVIIGTSIIGSYCLMRGISFFLINEVYFIDEITVSTLASSKNFDKIKEMIWGIYLIYPCMLIVFIIVSIIVQIKLNPNWKDLNYKELDENTEAPKVEQNFLLMDKEEGDTEKP